ncbi:MAG: hypothetical protein AAF821_01350 [Cyanobacteria bacterium P01_D01_bin.156]
MMTGTVVAQKFEDIATWMTSNQPTDLPNVLKGVFFMDGNPLPDDCINMYNLDWDETEHRLTLPVTAPAQWTFHRNLLGWLLLRGAQLANFRYIIQFEDATLQSAQIIPIAFGLTVPRWIVDATMCQHEGINNGELWDRKNVWLGGIPRVGEYVLRRIVDENGQYTAAFQDMLTKVDAECLVVR